MHKYSEKRLAGTIRAMAGISAAALIAGSLGSVSALAQTPAAAPEAETSADIIVTARKRDESALKAPVILDVLTPQKLEQLHVTNVYALNSVVPSLTIVPGGSFTGVTAALRGLGNGASANYADQTVAMNLDGLTVPTGAFYRAGSFDLGQLEVLKGPQALFFGKSTSGGVIILHTADPTKEWDSKISTSYETDSDETEVNGFISGPITDSLGFRIAGVMSRSEGYLINRNPASSDRRKQGVENDGVRATLAYDANAGVRVKVKAFYARNKTDGDLPTISNTICPNNVTPFAAAVGYDDCRLNRTVIGLPDAAPYKPASYGPGDFANFAVGSPSPLFRDGSPYNEVKMAGVPLQVDVDVSNGLTLTSLSGYQWARFKAGTTFSNGPTLFTFAADDKIREFSQELRLTSDWKDSWINFMAGGLYSDQKRDSEFVFVVPVGAYYSQNFVTLKTKQSSAFAQVMLTPIDRIELSAGARYTRVHRYFSRLNNFANFNPVLIDNLNNVSRGNRNRTETDFSPEVTLSYRPTDNLTLFGSYKQGYKAHSFNALLTAYPFDDSSVSPYTGERVEGFEGGIKGKLLDNRLSFTLTGYRYNYDDLQVSFTDATTAQVLVSNGANARVQGVEFTADYSPRALPGLTLSVAANYNDAYFRSFLDSPCYASQTAAQGCTLSPRTGALSQNQAGNTLPFAAKWTGNVGLDYATELGEGFSGGFNIRAAFTSDYETSPERNPLGHQKGYTLLDAGIRAGRTNEAWTVSLLCRNCTNKFYIADSIDSGTVTVPGQPSPVFARLARPRQIVLQLTVRPGRW